MLKHASIRRDWTMTVKKATGKTANGKRSTTHPKATSAARRCREAEPRSAVAAIDSRSNKDRRNGMERRKKDQPVAVEHRHLERRAKVNRRRQIDPTTCERDYTVEEIEFMGALDDYKRRSGRMFPTCSEVLEVVRSLGYEKRPATVVSLASAVDISMPSPSNDVSLPTV
jgi:hypothetical protein